MAFAYITGAAAVNTTAGINTTGANLIVFAVGGNFSEAWTVSDNKSNTWTAATKYGSGDHGCRLYYCYNPTVGSGHTFTVTPTYNAIAVAAYSGSASTPFDVENGGFNNSSVTSFQPGSVTPTVDNCLVVSGNMLGSNASSPTINSSFTIRASKNGVAGTAYGVGIADIIQTTAGATNPTWSWTNSSTAAGGNASFKAAASATAKPPFPFMRGLRVM